MLSQGFSAEVTAVDENSVTLDQTLFYPLGGGQNWDTGYIGMGRRRSRRYRSKRTATSNTLLEKTTGLKLGDTVEGEIDWDRRHAHMRMHTAQHLVSGLVYEMYDGARTVGNQIHADRSRIDFNPVKFDEEMIEELFSKANEMVESNLDVTDCIMTREEINAIMPPERTNMDLLPISVKQLRIIRIGDNIDLCPCAGTHVRALGGDRKNGIPRQEKQG